MQPSRLRLFLQFLCFEILVILAAIFAFMTTRVLAQAIKQRFHMRDIRPQLAVEEPAMEPVPLPEINTPEKKSWGRRLVVSVAALLLASIIASTFLFSVHFFSGTLAQSTNADAQALAARHPQQRPDFERGVIYPQWYAGGYGVNDPIWQTNIDAMKKQTGAQWIEIPVLFSQASSTSTTVEVSASTPGLDGFVQGVQKAHSLGGGQAASTSRRSSRSRHGSTATGTHYNPTSAPPRKTMSSKWPLAPNYKPCNRLYLMRSGTS
jgi:hypothetical protein